VTGSVVGLYKRLKVRTFIYCITAAVPLAGKPEQWQFTIQSGILTSISSGHHSANERTLDPHSADPTMPQPATLSLISTNSKVHFWGGA